MSGEEIRFTRSGKEIKFELDKKADNDLEKKDKKALKPLFDAIVNYDGKKQVSKEEMKMLEDLQTIFANTGKTTDGSVIDVDDIKLADEFKKSGKNIKDFIAGKIKQINDAKEAARKQAELNARIEEEIEREQQEQAARTTTVSTTTPTLTTTTPAATTTPTPVVTQQDKNASFNRSMQNLKNKFNKDELTAQFTQTVEYQKGKYLYNIAKEALEAEGIEKPNAKQINDRIAQIALVNGIADVNNVPQSKYPLKVGSGTTAPVPPEQKEGDPAVRNRQGESPDAVRGTGTVPVETPVGGVAVNKDPDTNGWTESPNAPAPEGVELNGGTLKTYTKGSGEATETKYVYEKDGIKVEATTVDDLKTKVETIKTALTELTTAPEGETPEAKQTRIQGAIDKLMGLGTESAVKVAQQKLAENKANVTADYNTQKTIAMIKSMNPALIEQILGAEGANFAALVQDNPAIQQALGDVVKYLNDKFNNDEYLTLDEQKIKAILDKCVDVDGVSIAAKAAVAANGETPAQAEVFAKTMVTDYEGNSYYKATLGGEGAFKDVEFRAKDDKVLDAFLADLKVADTDEKKTALFKKYAEMENADPELLKSIVAQAPALKASAEDVIALVNKSNLDVIYAMDTSHFTDVEEADGQAEVKDKTNVQNAIKARIEAIMADPTLAKLPENAKYLDKIKEINIAGQQTEFTKTPDLTGYTSETIDVNGVNIIKYTKEGQPDVYAYVNATSTIYANSQEEILKLKQEGDLLNLNNPADTAEKKRDNIEKLVKVFELTPQENQINHIILILEDENLIDKNDPDAKALVQKLLLTRDADIVRALVKTEGSVDNTLFENDPVALKTLAAMFKEIRDKEKLPDPDNKLTPEQIALKDVLDDCVVEMKTGIENGNTLQFDGDGNLAVHNGDWSGNNSGAVAMNSAQAENYNWANVLNDPILSKDKHALATWLTTYNLITKEVADKLFSLDNQSLDAELLSYVNFSNLDSEMSAEDKKAVQDAYVAKAKALFQYDTPAEGAKLDPANARYLKTILDKIDSISTAGSEEGAVDPDKAVIDEILGQFFVTTGEGENAVTTIKDFRRFTYEEMQGLADAVSRYGTDAQKTALANMITIEDMEDGQFANVIANRYGFDQVTVDRLANLITEETTKEDALAMIEKLEFKNRIPYDKLIEKFGDDAEFMNTLVKNYAAYSKMSEANRIKIAELYLKKDNNGNYTIDRSKLPEGVTPEKLLSILDNVRNSSTEANKSAATKMSDTILKSLTKDDIDVIQRLSGWYDINEIKNTIARIVKSNPESALDMIEKFEEEWHDAIGKDLFPYSQIVASMSLTEFGEKANEFVTKVLSYYSREGANDTNLGNLIKNGYIKKYTGISDYPMYSVPGQDDVLYRAWKKQNTTTFQPIKVADWNAGRALHAQVQNASLNKNTLAKINEVTKDNVVGIITGFNSLSGSRIMEQLDDEWGLEAKDMNKIPLALLEYCKGRSCETNNGWQAIEGTPAYLKLQTLMEAYANHTGDYDLDKSDVTDKDGKIIPDARLIDNLMHELLSLLERNRVAGEGISYRE